MSNLLFFFGVNDLSPSSMTFAGDSVISCFAVLDIRDAAADDDDFFSCARLYGDCVVQTSANYESLKVKARQRYSSFSLAIFASFFCF